MMNVLVILHAEVITVMDPLIHHLRIVVKIHQQLLQQPQPLQPPQLRVIILCWVKVYNLILLGDN